MNYYIVGVIKMLIEQPFIERIRNLSLQNEKEGRLASEALNLIVERGWFKMFLPESLGGQALSLPEALHIYEFTSWVDGSLGWVVTIGSGAGYFAGYMQEGVADHVFSPRDSVIAGSGTPVGAAVQVDGGYIINGKWHICSGSRHATAFTANCLIENDDSADQEIRTFVLSPHQVDILFDWHAFGLKATDGHTIVAHDQFVPDDKTFSLSKQLSFLDEPLFNYPFLQFAQASFAAVNVGIARHFLDEAKSIAALNESSWNASKTGRYESVQRIIARMEDQLTMDNILFHHTINRSWETHMENKPFTPEEMELVSAVCKRVTNTALSCGQNLFPYLGISVIMENEPINQIWRDLQTASQHSMLKSFD